VEVARLQLDYMDVARLLDPGEVLSGEHCALAQVGSKVVDEHAADNVFSSSLSPQSVRLHYWQHRFGLSTPAVIRLYNTFTRAREVLTPADAGAVRIYSCGPTVYRYVHIGNLRTFMLPDLLTRTLEYLGYRTHQVMNITDVGHLTDDSFDRGEDKMLVSARLEKKSPEEIATYYTRAFHDDAATVNIRPAADYPQASHYIPQMIELITKLIEKGHAYEVGGTVYYDIASFPAYGKLSRNSTDKLLAGARGEVDPRKRHPGDFTLWKAAGEHRLQVWPSPWGPGFPGWHIECSAMSMSLLGDRFDIHTGGADNVFPHHEAEIAQSEGVTGRGVVGCWMHGGLLMLAGTRMAKSAGNFFRIGELEEQGFDPLAFRYLALQAKYRTKLNFSAEGLAGADRALRSLRDRLAEWSRAGGDFDSRAPDVTDLEARFRAAIADDLDLPAVMALVAGLTHSALAPGAKGQLLRDWDRVLGLDLERAAPTAPLPPGAAALLGAREKARAARDFARSDELRGQLAAMGVAVIDTAEGQRWNVNKGSLNK
jgi:cysteinyl-tRNA synthetase